MVSYVGDDERREEVAKHRYYNVNRINVQLGQRMTFPLFQESVYYYFQEYFYSDVGNGEFRLEETMISITVSNRYLRLIARRRIRK